MNGGYESDEFVGTQLINENTIFTPDIANHTDSVDDTIISVDDTWGLLRKKNSSGSDDEIKLLHRIDNQGRKDLYTIGRNRGCDIVIDDLRVSSFHCMIYCDYSQPKLRVFIEDSSGKLYYLFLNNLVNNSKFSKQMERL